MTSRQSSRQKKSGTDGSTGEVWYLALRKLLIVQGPGTKPSSIRFFPGQRFALDGDEAVDVESLLPECEDLKTLSDMWEPTQGVPVLTTDDEEAIMCAVDALNSWSNMFSSPDKKRKYHDAAMFIFCRLEHAKNEANKTAHRAEKEASENV